MEKEEERFNLTVLGKTLGTYDGWDQLDVIHIIYYTFQADTKFSYLPSGDLTLNYETGEFTISAEGDENTLMRGNILNILSSP